MCNSIILSKINILLLLLLVVIYKTCKYKLTNVTQHLSPELHGQACPYRQMHTAQMEDKALFIKWYNLEMILLLIQSPVLKNNII